MRRAELGVGYMLGSKPGLRLRPVEGRLSLREIRRRHAVALHQRFQTGVLVLRPCQIGLRRLATQAILDRIERSEQLPRLHPIALIDEHAGHPTAHPKGNVGLMPGFHRAARGDGGSAIDDAHELHPNRNQ